MRSRAGCRLIAVFWAAVFLGHSATSVAQQKAAGEAVYTYDTPEVQLRGTLIKRRVFGPPGYGETPAQDLRTSILVLKLRQPITVEAVLPIANDNPDADTFRHVREVQLLVTQSQRGNAGKLVGRSISVTGTLNESVTAGEYTKVWLEVKTLKPE